MNRKQRRAAKANHKSLIAKSGAKVWLMPHLLSSFNRPSLNDRRPEDFVWQRIVATGSPFVVGKTYQVDGCFPMTVTAITHKPGGIFAVYGGDCMFVDAFPAVEKVAA